MTARDAPFVSVVVLNWNDAPDTLECLAAVSALDYPDLSVMVVDNGSTDCSVRTIRERYPLVTVFENHENLGFADGNNRGISYAREKNSGWVFILNPDTIVARDCLSKMIDVGSRDPTIGIIGPTVFHADEPAVVQSAGGKLDSRWVPTHRRQNELDKGQYREEEDVDWVTGCAMLINSQVIGTIGGFDRRFFMYGEELDFCIRARLAGYRIVHVPTAKVWHRGVSRDYHPSATVTYYMTRNHLLLLSKHQAGLHSGLAAGARMTRTLISWTVLPKWRDKRAHRDAMLQALRDHIQCKYGKRVTG